MHDDLVGRAAHRAAMADAHAMALINEIKVRVDLQDVNRPLPGEGLDALELHARLLDDLGDGGARADP